MRLLCPPGGTYWNPKPFWWLRNTYLATGAIRIWQATRFVGWLAAAVLSLIGTLLFQVFVPAVLWAWTLVVSFINFYIGLLFGQIVGEALVFVPFMLVALFWLNWLVWPQFGCFLEKAWPVFRQILDLAVVAVTAAVQILDLAIRIWNSIVPVIGFFIYVVVELQVQWYRLVSELLGEEEIDMLLEGMMSIMLQLSEISINVGEALISISPTILQVHSQVIGAVISIVIEVSPQLLQITTWLFRISPFTLAPITSLIVKVVEFVKKTFFLARLLLEVSAGAAGLYSAGLAATPSHASGSSSSDDKHSDDPQLRLWRAFGEASSRYWTPDTARRNTEHLDSISAWLLKNPPGSFSDYYVTAGFAYRDAQTSSYYAGRAPLTHDDDDTEHSVDERGAELPAGWAHTNSSHCHTGEPICPSARRAHHYPFARENGPLSAEPLHFDSEAERHAHYTGHMRLDGDAHLENDLHKRLPCRSRFCGGEGATVPHPLHRIRATHKRDRTLLSDTLVAKDVRSHRRRYAHGAAVLHATRHATHYSLQKHWRDGEGHLSRHLGGVLRQWTGHSSVGAAVESVLSRHEDPMDSIGTMIPVVSELPPFRYLLQYDPEREHYFGQWRAQRLTFLADVVDPYTGKSRKVLHVTVARLNESVTVQRLQEQHQQEHAGQRQMLQFTPFDPLGSLLNVPPGFPFTAALTAMYLSGRLLEPALPVLRMLYSRDCYDTPKHPWCMPNVPTQFICLLKNAMNVIPRDLPVQLCKYESACADIGFCIHDRPDLATPVWRVVQERRYFITLCWLQNFGVWIATALGLFFPVLRLNLLICKDVVPFIGPNVCGPVREWIPQPISFQQGVCLWIYAYAVALILIMIYLLRFFWALIPWARTTLASFFAMITAIRFMEMDRLDGLSLEPWYEEMLLRQDQKTRRSLHEDNVYSPVYRNVHEDDGDTEMAEAAAGRARPIVSFDDALEPETSMGPRELDMASLRSQQQFVLPPPQPLAQRISADQEAGSRVPPDRPRITKAGRLAMHHYVQALQDGIEMFGVPRGDVTFDHVLEHEARLHPIIDSGHYTWTYMCRAINEILHQENKRSARRPPHLGHKCTIGDW